MGDLKNIYILQVHFPKKKHFCTKLLSKKHSRTYSKPEKKFWQDVSWVDTLNFISRLLKDFSIDLDVGKRDYLHNDVPPSDGFFFTFIAPVVTNLDTCFLNFKITAGVVI